VQPRSEGAASQMRGSEEATVGSVQPVAVRVEAIRKTYGDIEAVRGVSFEVRAGEIYGLLGPNGAGKSTIIEILSGLLSPDSGSARIDGHEASSIKARRLVGLVPQDVALYLELNARENLWFFGQLYGLTGARLSASIGRVLEIVNLADRAREAVGRYSGGMLRRLNIAAGILHSPKVVLMDEPTVGLDPQNRLSILELIRSVAASGAALVYCTHYLDEVERICSRVGIVDRGRLLVEGTLAELHHSVGDSGVVTLRGSFSPPSQAPDGEASGELIKATEEEIVLSAADVEPWIESLLSSAGCSGTVREVLVNRQSLDALFIKLTGRELRE
jgi:ABC-2 type transport system ATP-binding protein